MVLELRVIIFQKTTDFKMPSGIQGLNKKASFAPKCCNFWTLYAITTKLETDTANMLRNITQNYFCPEIYWMLFKTDLKTFPWAHRFVLLFHQIFLSRRMSKLINFFLKVQKVNKIVLLNDANLLTLLAKVLGLWFSIFVYVTAKMHSGLTGLMVSCLFEHAAFRCF